MVVLACWGTEDLPPLRLALATSVRST